MTAVMLVVICLVLFVAMCVNIVIAMALRQVMENQDHQSDVLGLIYQKLYDAGPLKEGQ